MTFTCTLSSLVHEWQVSSRSIIRALLVSNEGETLSDSPFQFTVTEVRTGISITSTATVNATADLNGTLILCRDVSGMLPDQNSTINLIGENI